jgi:hypothetical protein
MKTLSAVVLVLAFALRCGWALADTARDLEVVQPNTPIFAEPSEHSAVVTKVKPGQRLQALGEKSGFYQLKTKSGKAMWVSVRNVVVPEDPAADLEIGDTPPKRHRNQPVDYPRFTFDVSGAAGANTFGSFYELQGGVNTFFNEWFVWRNAPFYRFFGANSAFGLDSSLRAQASLPAGNFTPTFMAGAGYRLVSFGTSAPFLEAGLGLRAGGLNLNLGAKYLFNTFIDAASPNQFLYSVGVSAGGSF